MGISRSGSLFLSYFIMKLLFSIGGWNPLSGGPFFSVGNLVKQLNKRHSVSMVVGNYPHRPSAPAPEGVKLIAIQGRLIPYVNQTILPEADRVLARVFTEERPDLVHDNGLWLTLNHKIATYSSRNNVPRILSPRGTLDTWAINFRSWKKRIALALYQKKDLACVHCFHAASASEAHNIRKLGFQQPIALIPNGVPMPPDLAKFSAEDSSQKRVALFLGRVHPIKNLPSLLHAWAKVRPSNWILRIVGSDENNHKQELRALAAKLCISNVVEILDPVYEQAKKFELLKNSQLAFLLSHSENFGIAAAEAMSVGVPVVASRGTPWSALEEKKIGWWVQNNIAAISTVLAEATSMRPEELQKLGIAARAYMSANFDWPVIAEQFEELYSWTLSKGKQPDFVI